MENEDESEDESEDEMKNKDESEDESADSLAEAESTTGAKAADCFVEAERSGTPSPAKSPEEVYVEALLAAGKGDAGNESAQLTEQPQEAAMPAEAEPAGQNTLEARMLYVQQQLNRWVSHTLGDAIWCRRERAQAWALERACARSHLIHL